MYDKNAVKVIATLRFCYHPLIKIAMDLVRIPDIKHTTVMIVTQIKKVGSNPISISIKTKESTNIIKVVIHILKIKYPIIPKINDTAGSTSSIKNAGPPK
ncbi:hypothetical protein [Bacillus sp. RHFS10]|uniref:hypothetical protein n=1 Tax=Bacillus sp. RHFS10 TaxID=2804501 RepID=UPI00403FF20E